MAATLSYAGQSLEVALSESEIEEAGHYIQMFQYYQRLRAMEISINATDMDIFTLNIIYTIQQKLDEMSEKKGGD